MIYIREFEVYEADGFIIATPCDMDGGTFGTTLEDAITSSADWLYETITDDLAHERSTQGGMLGHEPIHGGKIIEVAVDCDLKRVDAVTAADAARILGVSSARVAQMCDSGQLTSWRDDTRRMVMRSSVNARLAEHPQAGRPRKAAIG